MFKIRNVAAEGFDRAIIAMRRENVGREASDSEWRDVEIFADNAHELAFKEFEIGPEDKAECLKEIKAGRIWFTAYAVVWMHIEAPAEWWRENDAYFDASSVVERKGDVETKSVVTTYEDLLMMVEDMLPTVGGKGWEEFNEICRELEELPESWLILGGLEVNG